MTASCSFVSVQVSFVISQTREFSSKTGRDLLATIASVHPFVMSVLVWRVKDTISTVGKVISVQIPGGDKKCMRQSLLESILH